MAFLELTGVQKLFGDVAAVIDFNLAVEKGEFVSFLGPSGCGKTTTLRMIAGFEKPTAGLITIDGRDITYQPPNQRNVGMVFQSYALFPNMSVGDNIGFGLQGPEAAQGRDREAGRGAARADPPRGSRRPLPVAAVGRPAAARRAGAGARDRAAGAPPRRAAVGARRQDPAGPAQGDPGDPAPARDHHRVRHPRPGGGAVAVRPRGGHERGPDRADRDAVGDLQLPDHRVRGLVRRHAQPGQGRRHRRGLGTAVARRPGGPDDEGHRRGARTAGRSRSPSGPEGIALGEGAPGSNRLRGTVDDINFLGSIVRIRLRVGDGANGDPPNDDLTRPVQRPEPQAARHRRGRDRLVPARGVLRAGRGR